MVELLLAAGCSLSPFSKVRHAPGIVVRAQAIIMAAAQANFLVLCISGWLNPAGPRQAQRPCSDSEEPASSRRSRGGLRCTQVRAWLRGFSTLPNALRDALEKGAS